MFVSDRVEGFGVAAVSEVDASTLSTFLEESSRDSGLCDATYLPSSMTFEQAGRWAAARASSAWVLLVDGRAVGWWEFAPVKSSCGFALPGNTFEREVWLLEGFRGRRLVQEATRLLRPELLRLGVQFLLGVTWDTNVSAIRGMSRAGFVRLGRGWWQWCAESPGWCEVWLLELGDGAGAV